MGEQFLDLTGKEVAIVGPAAYMIGSGLGNKIDDHDVVVRLNRGVESITDYSSDIGFRTDILYSCLIEKPGNAGSYEPENLISDYNIKAVVAPPHSDFRGFAGSTRLHELVDRNKARRLSSLVPLRIVDHKFHNQLALAVQCKPNTGFMAIYDLLRFDISKLSVYGFSFYLDGFIPGCKAGVEQTQKMTEEQFAEKCFNSKRVPRKNFRLFRGTPLYKFVLSRLNNFQIYVDTDSQEIFSNIESDPDLCHVEVYWRDPSLVGDRVSVCDLMTHFLKKYEVIDQHFCQAHVTSPFVSSQMIQSAAAKLDEGYDSVVSCNTIQTRFWRKEDYGFAPINHNPLKLEQTQDLPVYYEENSVFYIVNTAIFLDTGVRVGRNPCFYPLTHPENIDIDTEQDWDLATKV